MQRGSSRNRPGSYEKLPHKEILDQIRRKRMKQEEAQASTEPDDTPVQEELPHTQKVAKKAKAQEKLELALDPDKKYFRIGEAAELIQVEPYVLRYWESEFNWVRPRKAASGHRVYSKKDLLLFEEIRNLLYVERFSIKQAKKELYHRRKNKKQEVAPVPQKPAPELKAYRENLVKVAGELRTLIQVAKSSPWDV